MKHTEQHTFTPEQIGAYYDGQLTETERLEVEQHLKQCAACQAVLTELSLVDKAVEKAEGIKTPEGYFQTFGSAVANRIAQQKLAPQKEAKRFSWGWVTAAAALASLAIVLVSGDLTKPRLYRSVPEEQRTVLLEAPAISQPTAADEAKYQAPAQSSKSLEAAPELNLAEAPAEEAGEETPAQEIRKMEAAPEMDLAEVSMEKEAPSAAPAKRAKSMEMAASISSHAIGSAGISDKKDLAAKPASVQASVKGASSPAPAPVSLATSQVSPSSVETVTVIEICLPDGNKDCPEPKVRSAIRINLDGI
ncbi:zf-HC2 domain-containing protein [candidate division TA06 bacterium]|nr:zf-HC2 domain-containing protein [candidate division TA06 bacterium]